MRRPTLSTVAVLDAAARLVPLVFNPWVGVLWLTALPVRLIQLYFYMQLMHLDDPSKYLYYLWSVSSLAFAAFFLSLYGRAVYVRACRAAQNTDPRFGLRALLVPLSDFIPYLYTALLLEILFYLSLPFFFAAWLVVALSGLSAAASQGASGPKFIGAPFETLRLAASWRPLLGVLLASTCGLLFAEIDLYVLTQVLLWICAPILGADLPRWQKIFQAGSWMIFPKSDLVCGLMWVGATLIIEPFWLAAQVALVQQIRARGNGEDLSLWFAELKAAENGGSK